MNKIRKKSVFKVNSKCIFELTSKEDIKDEELDDGHYYLEQIGAKSNRIPLENQILITLGPLLLFTLIGYTAGFNDTLDFQYFVKYHVYLNEGLWIGTLFFLPASVGCFVGGFWTEKYGRRMTLMQSCIPFTIGWLIYLLSDAEELIVIARLITGFLCGFISTPSLIYVGENTDPKFRGALLALVTVGVPLGNLITHSLGIFLHWKIITILCGLTSICCFIKMYYVPDSAPWLIKKNKIHQAKMSFHWSRGNSDRVEKELEESINEILKHSETDVTLKNIFNLKRNRTIFKSFSSLALFMLSQQWISSDIAWNVICEDFSIDKRMCSISQDILKLIFTCLACFLFYTLGRRFLTMLSGFGSFLILFSLILVIINLSNVSSYIILLCLSILVAFSSIGLIPVPWVMIAEIFPIRVRGIYGSCVASLAFIGTYFFINIFPVIIQLINVTYFYSLICFITLTVTIVLYFILPETKGKPLFEIENHH